jgi:hypothetical protein
MLANAFEALTQIVHQMHTRNVTFQFLRRGPVAFSNAKLQSVWPINSSHANEMEIQNAPLIRSQNWKVVLLRSVQHRRRFQMSMHVTYGIYTNY